MQVSKPSLGKYLRRAVATRSWRLELEVTLERTRRPISKKGTQDRRPVGPQLGEGGGAICKLTSECGTRPRGGQMPLLDGLAAVEERRWLALQNGGSGLAP